MEIEINTSDGASSFRTRVYLGHEDLKTVLERLNQFKFQVHGGICDFQLGEFGPEYANGAFHARLHFHEPGRGRIFGTVRVESDWRDFKGMKVASHGTLYLTTEPALLDHFVRELQEMDAGVTDGASLRGG